MFRYLVRRLLWAVVLFIAVTLVTYVIFFIIPANPAARVCGKSCGPDDIKRAEHFLGIDKPVYIQYLRFLNRLLPVGFKEEGTTGNYEGFGFKTPSLGSSFTTRRDVNT